jgi:hypothetical protein
MLTAISSLSTEINQYIQGLIEWFNGSEVQYYFRLSLLLIIFSLFLSWLRNRQPRHVIAFTSEESTVSVTSYALAELIQKTALTVDGILKCSTRIGMRNGLLRLNMRIHMKADHRLREVTNLLELRITETIKRTLGIPAIGPINVIVSNLVGETEEKPRDYEYGYSDDESRL